MRICTFLQMDTITRKKETERKTSTTFMNLKRIYLLSAHDNNNQKKTNIRK